MEDSDSIITKRAEALASAYYYTECCLRSISSTNASAAEVNACYNQSKWWLHGNDPKHPAHNSVLHDATSKSDEGDAKPGGNPTQEQAEEDHHVLIDGQNDEEGEEGSDSDWDAPIFARDDDYPSSQTIGLLNNLQFKRDSSRSNAPFRVTSSSLPLDSSKSCVEDVIRSFSAYSNHYVDTSDKTLLPRPRFVSHPITSESEADESFYVSEMSQDEASSAVRTGGIESPRKRFRVSLDEDATLEKTLLQAKVDRAKTDLLSSVEETSSKTFSESLKFLEQVKRCNVQEEIDGTWRMISQPDYPSCLGANMKGDKLYTLERMSFGMYHPGSLLCSIQQQFNTISSVKKKADMPQYVPMSLKNEVDDESGKCSGRMKTYNIIVSFTIETEDEDMVLRGIMTNYAYTLPDPSVPGRLSIFFTGGTIEPADEDEESVKAWKKVFGTLQSDKSEDSRGVDEARHLAQHILLGAVSEPMDDEGVIGYHLKRPIGGHGSAFCDIVYMDDDLRVMRGHSGSVYVFKRTRFD